MNPIQFELISHAPAQYDGGALIVATYDSDGDENDDSDGNWPQSTRSVDDASGLISQLHASGDLPGKGKAMLISQPARLAARRLIIVGLGKADEVSPSSVAEAIKAGVKLANNSKATDVAVACTDIDQGSMGQYDHAWQTRFAALCVAQSAYVYSETKDSAKPRHPLESAQLFSNGGDQNALQKMLDQAAGIARGQRLARQLGNLPPNICTPAFLAQTAQDIADEFDTVELEVLERDTMEEMGMGALLGVARGSGHPPKFIILKYSGGNSDQAPRVLVGKGITFDTGGISIKPGKNMHEMKYDMCGAASVIGTFLACAAMELPINLITIAPAVENMPDGRAYRPGDVITSLSGQTIEVLNTDAEGRMILCDALTYAERFEPETVIDVATLTGACVVALGHHASAVMSRDDALAEQLVECGNKIYDRAWRLPLWDDYQSQLDSSFADMVNVGGMPAGSITAGCFLSRFTKKYRWAHMDIAGSAWVMGGKEGATGRPVPLLSQYLIDCSE